MEGQITLLEWQSWKEDIRKRLEAATASFVGIGYRLKQIRDSKAYKQDGYEDLYSFAQAEYNLSKSTVSRFIAINDNFSLNGNSLELKEEYIKFGSSQLTEMLGLSDDDRVLITEQTTIKDIRNLKSFNKESEALTMDLKDIETDASNDLRNSDTSKEEKINPHVQTREGEEPEYSPLAKAIIAFFKDYKKEKILNEVMDCAINGDNELSNDKELAKKINPSNSTSFKKGLIFLFLYDFHTGIKIRNMKMLEPEFMSWPEFIQLIVTIFWPSHQENNTWKTFYPDEIVEEVEVIKEIEKEEIKVPKEEPNKEPKVQEKPVTKTLTPVATSQQNTKKQEDISDDNASKPNDREGREETKEEPIEQIKSNGENSEVSKDNNLSSRELESSENEETEKNQTILSPVVTEESEPIVETVKEVKIKQFPSAKLESKEERALESGEMEKAYSDINKIQEDINELENGIWEVLRMKKKGEESEEIEDFEINEEKLLLVKNAKKQALKINEDLSQIIVKWESFISKEE